MTYRGRCAGRRQDGMQAHRARRIARQYIADQGGWTGIHERAMKAIGLVRMAPLYPAAMTPEERDAKLADLEARTAQAMAGIQRAHRTLVTSASDMEATDYLEHDTVSGEWWAIHSAGSKSRG